MQSQIFINFAEYWYDFEIESISILKLIEYILAVA